jgi:hypothetical protein
MSKIQEIKDPYLVNPKDLLGNKKPDLWVVPDSAYLHLSMAMRDGGFKYDPYNWRGRPVVASVYLNAILRHHIAWKAGEEYAKDSGVHHLGHLMACAAILIDARETENLIDNRVPDPAVLKLLVKLQEQIEAEERDKETGRLIVK